MIRKTLAAAALFATIAGAAAPAAAGPWHGPWGYHPWGWGVGAAAAGLAIGAAAAAAAAPYDYAPACYFSRQPVLNAYGDVVGYRRVRVCN